MRKPLFFLLLLFLPSVPARAGTVDTIPTLEQIVTLDIWGGGLQDVMQAVKQQANIDIIPFPPDFPPGSHGNLYLVTGRVQLRTVLECLSRRYAFRYRVSNTGKVELSKRYDWASVEPALKFARLDTLFNSGQTAESVQTMLLELVKPVAFLGSEYTLTLERSPARDNPQAMRAVIVMPPVLADYLERGIRCLLGDPGDSGPGTGAGSATFASAWDNTVVWEDLLAKQLRITDSGNARSIFRAVAAQAQIAILLTEPPTNENAAMPAAGDTTLGQISEQIGERYGFATRTFLASGAIYFEPGDSPGWEMDGRQGELYWSGLAVAGFDARLAVQQTGGAEVLLADIRAAVFPHIWSVPVCALTFSPASNRLCVIAPRNAVQAVGEYLTRAR